MYPFRLAFACLKSRLFSSIYKKSFKSYELNSVNVPPTNNTYEIKKAYEFLSHTIAFTCTIPVEYASVLGFPEVNEVSPVGLNRNESKTKEECEWENTDISKRKYSFFLWRERLFIVAPFLLSEEKLHEWFPPLADANPDEIVIFGDFRLKEGLSGINHGLYLFCDFVSYPVEIKALFLNLFIQEIAKLQFIICAIDIKGIDSY